MSRALEVPGPIVHIRNDGAQQLLIAGRFLGPKKELRLRGAVPGGVRIVGADGTDGAQVPEADVQMLARLVQREVVWISDPAYLVGALPEPVAPTMSPATALQW